MMTKGWDWGLRLIHIVGTLSASTKIETRFKDKGQNVYCYVISEFK